MSIKNRIKSLFAKNQSTESPSNEIPMKTSSKIFKRLVSGSLAFAMGMSTILGNVPAIAPITANAATSKVEIGYINGNSNWFYWIESGDTGTQPANDIGVFCVQYGTSVYDPESSSQYYIREDSQKEWYIDEQKVRDYISLIGYYGYPNGMPESLKAPVGSEGRDSDNLSNQDWFMASQGLIWAKVGSYNINNFATSRKKAADKILKRIEKHYTKASYDNDTFKLTYNSANNRLETTVTDSNELFNQSDFKKALEAEGFGVEILSDRKAIVYADVGTNLNKTITINKTFNYRYKFQYREYQPNSSNYKSQIFAFATVPPSVKWSINLKAEGGPTLSFQKTFKNSSGRKITNSVKTTQGDYTISQIVDSGAFKFKIYDISAGGYVRASKKSNGNYLYTNSTGTSSNATVFDIVLNSTDNTGDFSVANISNGHTFRIEEIIDKSNPIAKNFDVENPVEIAINGSSATSKMSNRENGLEAGLINAKVLKEWNLQDSTLFSSNPKLNQDLKSSTYYNNSTAENKAKLDKIYFKAYIIDNNGNKQWLKLKRRSASYTDYSAWIALNRKKPTNGSDYCLTLNSFTTEDEATQIPFDEAFRKGDNDYDWNMWVQIPDSIWDDSANSMTALKNKEIYFCEYGISHVDYKTMYNFAVTGNKTYVDKQRYYRTALIKVDNNNQNVPISGAVYGLYDSKRNDMLLESATTDENGIATFATPLTVEYGRYYVKEITAPNGYQIDNSKHDLFIQNLIASLSSMENRAKADKLETDILSESNSSLFKNFESYSRNGYNISYIVNGATETKISEKPQYGTLKIQKKDTFGRTVSNVTFGLYVGEKNIYIASSNTYATYKTSDGTIKELKANTLIETKSTVNGDISWENLPYGSYQIKELSNGNSNPFVITYNTVNVTIDSTSPVVVDVENKPQQVELTVTKKDSKTGTPLAGAQFKLIATKDFYFNGSLIHHSGDTVIEKLITDENGKAYSWIDKQIGETTRTEKVHTPLYVNAEYQLVEIKAPDGYTLNTALKPFTVSRDTTPDLDYVSHEETITDIRKTVSLRIHKVEKDGTPRNDDRFTGAEFDLYTTTDIKTADGSIMKLSDGRELKANTWIEKLITDGSGYATSVNKLPTGYTYLIKETKAPKGYKIANPITVSIPINPENDSCYIAADYAFEKIIREDEANIKLKITKLDENGNIVSDDKFDGTAFAVYHNGEGSALGTAVISNGEATFIKGSNAVSLEPGQTYSIVEAPNTVPEGYNPISRILFTLPATIKDGNTVPVTGTNPYVVDGNGKVTMDGEDYVLTYTVKEPKKPVKLKVIKLDENGNIVTDNKFDGTTFTLYPSVGGSVIGTASILNGEASFKNGTYDIGLNFGQSYSIVENPSTVPVGYKAISNIVFTMPASVKDGTEIITNNPYVVDGKGVVSETNDSYILTYTVKEPKKPIKLKVIKLDENGEPKNDNTFNGTQFVLYPNGGGSALGTATINNNEATFKRGTYDIALEKGSSYMIVEAPNTVPAGYTSISNINFTMPSTITNGTSVTTDCPYVIDGKGEISETNDAYILTYSVSEPKELKIKVVKYDENDNDKKLANAVFELYAAEDGVKIGNTTYNTDALIETSAKTNADGEVFFTTKLPTNKKYFVKEKIAPDGYALNLSKFYVSVIDTPDIVNDNVATVEVPESLKILSVSVLKVDENNGDIPLPGAVFELYANENGIKVGNTVYNTDDLIETSAATGTNGRITFVSKLPADKKYYVKEKVAPRNYVADTETKHYISGKTTQEQSAYTARIKVTNRYQYGEINVFKYSEVNGHQIGLKDAEFVLICADSITTEDGTSYEAGEVIETITTDDNGYAKISKKVPVGHYYNLKETKAPENYVRKGSDVFPLEWDASREYVEVERSIKNDWQEGEIYVFKKDGDTNVGLANAKFTLYANDTIGLPDGTVWHVGDALQTVTTDADGYAHFNRVPVGYNYSVKEVEAPDGFVNKFDTKLFKLEYSASVEFVTNKKFPLSFTNTRQNAKISVYKHNSKNENEPIKGAGFTLYAPADIDIMNTDNSVLYNRGSVIETVITDENGKANFKDVPVGYNYILKETTVPEGFKNTNFEEVISAKYDKALEYVEIKKSIANDEIDVSFSKKKLGTTNEVIGATLQVTDSNGELVEQWTSNGTDHVIKKMKPGSYTLKETYAPDGYIIATDINFNIDTTGNVTVNNKTVESKNGIPLIVMYDDYTQVEISKQDITNAKEIAGAILRVYDTTTNGIVDRWMSVENESHTIAGKLVVDREYILIEAVAPDGYLKAESIRFTIDKDNKIHVNGTIVDKVVMKDEHINVKISKQDITTKKEIAGAHLRVLNSDNSIYDEWTSEANKSHTLDNIPAGTYTLEETIAPAGYLKQTNSILFTVDEKGKTYVDGYEVEKVIMNDDYTKLAVTKIDKKSGNTLEGAILQILKSDGSVYAEWTSSTTAYRIDRIPVGNYILHEKTAPAGYIRAKDKPFTITAEEFTTTNYVKTIEMEDARIDVDISKRDIVDMTELEGATLTVTQTNGTYVNGKPFTETWVSNGTTHTLERVPAGDYKLVETISPEGYVIATTINFTVDENGKVTSSNTTVETDKSNPIVVMKDDYTHVTISKKDITNSSELEGATLIITSKEGKTLDKVTATRNGVDITSTLIINGNTITFVSGNKETVLSKLPVGEYTLTEKTAPNGYTKAESIDFSIDSHNKVTVNGTTSNTVVMEDKPTSVTISKKDIINKNELSGAKLTITSVNGKSLENVIATREGTAVTLTKNNNSVSFISGNAETILTKLPVGEYTLTETAAPDGYVIASSINFSIDENGKITINNHETSKVEMTDDVNKLTIVKKDKNTDKLLEGASLTLTVSGNVDLKNVIFTAPSGTSASQIKRTAHSITWVSGKVDGAVFKKLPNGTYTIHEEVAPNGYAINTKDTTFTVVNGKINNVDSESIIDFYNSKSFVKFVKDYKFMLSPAVEGAQFSLTSDVDVDWDNLILTDIIVVSKEDRKLVFKSIAPDKSGKYPMTIVGLPNGNYTLVEDKAPATFIKDENNYNFSIVDGHFIYDGVTYDFGEGEINIENEASRFYVTKTDENGVAVSGAVLALYDEQGHEIARWTTNGKPKLFEGLPFGTYTVKELKAPNGFNTARDMTFEHNGENNGSTFTVINRRGFIMPQTGGKGTTAFTIIGSVMFIIGLAYRLRRKTIANV